MKRSFWILLALLAILVIATILVFQRPGETSSSGRLDVSLAQFDSAAIDRIEITSSTGSVTLAREGGRWMLQFPIRYPADESAVREAVGKAGRMELKNLVSSNPDKQHIFQVDSTGTLVRFFDRGAERAVFRVGKVGRSFRDTYVRGEGSNNVYLADGIITPIFDRKPDDWRDKRVFAVDQDDIRNVRFRYGDTTFTLSLQDSVWLVDESPANSATVTSFLGSVSTLRADTFIDTEIPLPEPVAILDLDGVEIRFYQSDEENRYRIQTSLASQVFVLNSWRVSQVLKRKPDFQQSGS
jgi:hypothetical protein